ncbi:MAG TPA: YggS family pyridoxal phosphate-dependent enzyme [Gaiellales bacterium]|jgi:pyridoxal phosphate enzyme (YggS family)|nr:YggS family pyridoxal phosphate-dependent enzyme [Gaiellales bacterium]
MSVELAVVQHNLALAQAAIADAAARSNRTAEAVELLAAVKYVDPCDLAVLADAGIGLVGENRVEQLLAKQAVAGDRFTWDFIGHLQSRKARDLVGRVRLVHSLSTLSAAERLDRASTEPIACLVEVNAAGEASKQGLPPDELDAFLEAVAALPNLRIEGLMTMPPLAAAPEASRRHFAALRELAERLSARWAPQHAFGRLSMGTSQDYAVAVEEGATIVRLGSSLYRRSSV